MATLQGQKLKDTYIEVLKLDSSTRNTGATGTLKAVEDGSGTDTALSLSTAQITSNVDGTVSAPAFSRTTDTNTGIFFAAADTLALVTNGAERLRVDSSGTAIVGNGDTNASPAAVTVRGTNASGTNIAGSNLTIQPSRGTGTGAGGALIVQTAAAGSSGSSLNAAAEALRVTSGGELLVGTTTNTNTSKMVANGTISETVSSTQHLIASQVDVGTAPNKIPLNQFLGALAYQDSESTALLVGTGISGGTNTVIRASFQNHAGVKMMRLLIDLRGLNSGGTAGDIIGVNGTANPCYIARVPSNFTILGGRMTCLETPAGGDTDFDLYSAVEDTGVEDAAIAPLTETEIINAGVQSRGTATFFSANPAANSFLYLVGQGTANATYTAGRFLIEAFGS